MWLATTLEQRHAHVKWKYLFNLSKPIFWQKKEKSLTSFEYGLQTFSGNIFWEINDALITILITYLKQIFSKKYYIKYIFEKNIVLKGFIKTSLMGTGPCYTLLYSIVVLWFRLLCSPLPPPLSSTVCEQFRKVEKQVCIIDEYLMRTWLYPDQSTTLF